MATYYVNNMVRHNGSIVLIAFELYMYHIIFVHFTHNSFCLLSLLIGHTTAQDMLNHFNHGVLQSGLAIKDMLQIGMDGPNVNWKFYSLIQKQLIEEYSTRLINVGSCGLHTVHNSFKAGVKKSGWNVSSFLSSLYYLYKDSPARREDYRKVSSSTVLPLKFVSHRWLENVPVTERALQKNV